MYGWREVVMAWGRRAVILVLSISCLLLVACPGETAPTPAVPPSPTPSRDKVPPHVSNLTPAGGAVDVSLDAEIGLHVVDEGAGVDLTSIVMSVDGQPVEPVITGSSKECVLSYRPAVHFDYGRTVQVSLVVRDLGTPPNLSSTTYSFTTLRREVKPPPGLTGTVRLNLKSYGNHTAEYDARVMAIRPEYVIDNPPHGLYGEMYGYESKSLLQRISAYKEAGIKIIGYVTAGYEGRQSQGRIDAKLYSLEMNKKLVRNMALIDGVDGVFIDECTAFPNLASKEYLRQFATYAHSFGLIVWGNVGQSNFDPWFFTDGGYDLIQSTEDWRGQTLTRVQQEWAHRISVTGFKPHYTKTDAYNLTIDAWQKGIAYCYINDVEYMSIAPWFEEYANMLRGIQPNGSQNHSDNKN